MLLWLLLSLRPHCGVWIRGRRAAGHDWHSHLLLLLLQRHLRLPWRPDEDELPSFLVHHHRGTVQHGSVAYRTQRHDLSLLVEHHKVPSQGTVGILHLILLLLLLLYLLLLVVRHPPDRVVVGADLRVELVLELHGRVGVAHQAAAQAGLATSST